MKQTQCLVLGNKEIARDYYELCFEWDTPGFSAGQFITIKPQGKPLLRRPFAISGTTDKSASIIFKSVGPGTREFTKLKKGDYVDILGPLGNTFNTHRENPILVAGGVGLGPMLYTARVYGDMGRKATLLIGARDRGLIPDLTLPESVEVVICTDDGSMGFKGNVVQYLETLNKESLDNRDIMACGPHIMLKGLKDFSNKNGNPLFVSLEEMMACAVGACYGCVVETTGETKYKRVCKDGPIFDAREILWT